MAYKCPVIVMHVQHFIVVAVVSQICVPIEIKQNSQNV